MLRNLLFFVIFQLKHSLDTDTLAQMRIPFAIKFQLEHQMSYRFRANSYDSIYIYCRLILIPKSMNACSIFFYSPPIHLLRNVCSRKFRQKINNKFMVVLNE